MALFSLGDIKFKKGFTKSGPLAPLTGSQYENTNFRFPIDIGNADKGHYMTFYIREQEKTSFGGDAAAMNLESEAGGLSKLSGAANQVKAMSAVSSVTDKISSVANKVTGSLGVDSNFSSGIGSKITSGIGKVGDALGGLGDRISEVGGNVQAGLNNVFGSKNLPLGGSSAAQRSVISTNVKTIEGGSLEFLKTTKRTTSAITLYMPDTLLYNFSQDYQQAAIGNEFGGQALAASEAGKSAVDAFKAGGGGVQGAQDALAALGPTAVEAGKQVVGKAAGAALGSQQTADVLLAATGRVINPMLEMIYRSPKFRSFQFDFNFYPRDEREALEVQKILKMFMFHQAPELLRNAPGFLVPPSQFDIEFYYAGKQNPNIPAIAPACILQTVDINYAPQGASFYEVPGETSPTLGGTGMPFAVNLVLQFQETTYLTKRDLSQDEIKQKTQNDGSVVTETPQGKTTLFP